MKSASVQVLAPQHRPRIVGSVGFKGGIGKSTIAAHLVVAAAKEGRRALAVDFDPQKSLSRWYDDRMKTDPNGTYGFAKFDIVAWRVAEWEDLFDRIQDYDVVVLDFPPHVDADEVSLMDLLRRTDLIILPTGTSKAEWEIQIDWMGQFRRAGLRHAKFVMSRADMRRKSFHKVAQMLDGAGLRIPAIIPPREDVVQCYDNGLTTLDVEGTKARDEFTQLWNTVKHEVELD